MAAYDNVELPGAPRPPNYAAPLVDFSWIGKLPEQFQEGQQYAQKRAQQTAFQNGLPKDENGNVDYNKVADTISRLGGTEAAQQMLPQLLRMQLANQSATDFQNADKISGGFGAPSVGTGNPAPGNAPPPTQPSADAHMPQTNAGPGSITGKPPGSILPGGEQIMGSDNAGPSPAPFMGASSPNTQPQQTAQATPQPGGSSVPNGFYSEGTARNHEKAATYLRQQGARYGALGDTAQAQTYEKAAEAHDATAKQIRDILGKNVELTPEQKNLASGTTAATATQKQTIDQSGKTWEGIQASATQYERDMKPVLTLAHGILSDPRTYTGIGADASLAMNKVRDLFGSPAAATLQQGLEKINAITTLSAVNQQRDQLMEAGGASARIFSQQIEQVVKSNPNLQNTVWGNRMLINIMDRIGQRSTQIRDMAIDYRAKHGGVLDDGFAKQVADYVKAHPAFTDQEAANPTLLGAPEAPPTIKTPAQAQAWKQAQGLKSGDPYRTPNGDIKYAK